MLLLRHLERVGRRFTLPVVTLGNFDGVHRGHQEILRRLVSAARTVGGQSVVLTFHPHPTAVLAPSKAPQLITDWRTRLERIAEFGVDAIIVQRFTRRFSAITADAFVQRLLVDGLGIHTVVVGHRVTFGHNRAGGAETLRRLGATCGFAVEVVGPVSVEGMLVSSSAVRRAIGAGDLQRCVLLLGRPPSVAGRVVHGQHRGAGLGFPTANLRVAGLMVPPDGVYAVRTVTPMGVRGGVANLGHRPTFAEHERSLEVHLFDVAADLYGRRLEVSFLRKLRDEVKFPSAQALVEQIARDVATAREVLADANAP
jgi:riboflavin kinase / FMN adenylyltransferase